MAKTKATPRNQEQSSSSTTDTAARCYKNVLFEFPSDDLRGTVIVRGNQMVIEIPEQKGFFPSLVQGELDGHVFRGSNNIRGDNALSISASWCDFGEVFAGVWIEEGNEMLFLFRLPR